MASEKTIALVLKTLPFRETSGIFHLLTTNHGLVHGIAKGIRKKKTSASFLERGFLIETVVYIKPHRDLCILGDIHIVDFYPLTRVGLIENALRDAMFEMVLATVSAGHPYPELFLLLKRFLEELEARRPRPSARFLWRFYQEFSLIMGFGFDLGKCVVCHKPMAAFSGGYLVVEKGGVTCYNCSAYKKSENFVPRQALDFLDNGISLKNKEMQAFSHNETRRLTRLFASYCQYHCDKHFEHKALLFLDSLLAFDEEN
jgi:DNA repair protein RecO